jgi:5-methylcytosine-specific restriction protein A
MGRLKVLAPRVATLAPVIARRTDEHGHDDAAEPWRQWMKSRRWKALRWSTLVRDRFTCQCGCGHIEPDTSLLVADHRIAHRGDPVLFWSPGNLQTLWKPHHDAAKQAEDRKQAHGVGGSNL